MAVHKKKTKAELKAQYERIKSRLNGSGHDYDSAMEGYTYDTYQGKLADSMLRNVTTKKRREGTSTPKGYRKDAKLMRKAAENEVARLNAKADAAYQNMMKAANNG